MRACSTLLIAAFLISVSVSFVQSARAESGVAARVEREDGTIRGLEIDTNRIEADPSKGTVKIRGSFARSEWTLVTGNSVVVSSESKSSNFAFDFPASAQGSVLLLMSVGPTGDTETARYRVYGGAIAPAPAATPVSAGPATDPSKHVPWSLGLSVTRISYTQDVTFNFSEWALTLRAGYTHVFESRRWEMGLSGFGTLLPFGATAPAGFSDLSLRFLGVNARFGYRFAQSPNGWAGSLLTGYYFTTTTYAGSSPFGFKNLAGPQLYPVITKLVAPSTLVGAYFKYSPVSQNFELLQLSNREIAAGLLWRKGLRNGNSVGLAFDWSNLKLSDDTTAIDVTTFGVGANYYF